MKEDVAFCYPIGGLYIILLENKLQISTIIILQVNSIILSVINLLTHSPSCDKYISTF